MDVDRRGTRASFVASAIVFGVGFATTYPTFAAYVMGNIEERRRGAAFGAMLAAIDMGTGTGRVFGESLARERLSALISSAFGAA
jgi:MFS family permease